MSDVDYDLTRTTLISINSYESDHIEIWWILAFVIALAVIFALVEKRERPKSKSVVKNFLIRLLFFITAVIGNVFYIIFYFCALFLLAGVLLWLVDKNLNSFSTTTLLIDAAAAFIFICLVRSKRIRQRLVKEWRYFKGNQ